MYYTLKKQYESAIKYNTISFAIFLVGLVFLIIGIVYGLNSGIGIGWLPIILFIISYAFYVRTLFLMLMTYKLSDTEIKIVSPFNLTILLSTIIGVIFCWFIMIFVNYSIIKNVLKRINAFKSFSNSIFSTFKPY